MGWAGGCTCWIWRPGHERPLNRCSHSVDDQVDWFDAPTSVYHDARRKAAAIWVLASTAPAAAAAAAGRLLAGRQRSAAVAGDRRRACPGRAGGLVDAASMAAGAAGVAEARAVDRHELPLIAAGVEREDRDAPGGRAHLAVGCDARELVERGAAGADDELADAARRIGAAIRILRREALVGVVVAVDDEIDVEVVQRAPEVAHVGIVAVPAGAEEWPMPIDRGAAVRCAPSSLRSHRPAASRGRGQLAVQRDNAPGADGVAVEPVAGGPALVTEICRSSPAAAAHVFVVAGIGRVRERWRPQVGS